MAGGNLLALWQWSRSWGSWALVSSLEKSRYLLPLKVVRAVRAEWDNKCKALSSTCTYHTMKSSRKSTHYCYYYLPIFSCSSNKTFGWVYTLSRNKSAMIPFDSRLKGQMAKLILVTNRSCIKLHLGWKGEHIAKSPSKERIRGSGAPSKVWVLCNFIRKEGPRRNCSP